MGKKNKQKNKRKNKKGIEFVVCEVAEQKFPCLKIPLTEKDYEYQNTIIEAIKRPADKIIELCDKFEDEILEYVRKQLELEGRRIIDLNEVEMAAYVLLALKNVTGGMKLEQ